MSNSNWNGDGGSRGGGGGVEIPQGLSLSNTVHSEIATSLPLPSLPVFCGALDQELRLFDERSAGSSRDLNRRVVLNQSGRIAQLLSNTDVSYLNFKGEGPVNCGFGGHLDLYDEVLRQSAEAFEYASPGLSRESISKIRPAESRFDEQITPVTNSKTERDATEIKYDHHDSGISSDPINSSKKRKIKKKGNDDNSSAEPNAKENQALKGFCRMVEDFCGRAEVGNDEQDESEWLHMSVADLRTVLNEVLSVRAKNILHLVPPDILERLLKVLDNQIHRAVGLSMIECENSDADMASSIFGALECIHAVLAIMAHTNMPKQIYKEEIIDRIVDFSRHQIMDVMLAYDPSFRAMHKPNNNGTLDAEEDEDVDDEFGSASKKKRTPKGAKFRKSVANKVSGTMNVILQKLCTIMGFLRDLLAIERLADSCILQLVRTCLTTFLVDNVQILQLKALSLISGVYYAYNQHRPYIMDEALQVMLKLPSSKRVARSYHLPDEEQRQIQLISALLLHLIQCSADLPELLRQSSVDPALEVAIDPTYPSKCHDSVTESCCLFWSRVLQRFTNTKSQDISELKTMLENLLTDLLSTLNLPEFPASASLLEVLCVLLLQNYGLKSKDIALRSMAIDLLGSIAARLKQDAVLCKKQQFWLVKELLSGGNVEDSQTSDACSICLDTRSDKSLFVCQLCQKIYHADCLGVREHEVSVRNFCCPICLCKKHLLLLNSNCESHDKERKSSRNNGIGDLEILQQMLLYYLEDAGSAEDLHIFTRWFYLCLWYKDDPDAQQKSGFYLARLKEKAVVRDSSVSGCLLTRDAVKKVTLALGQSSSFSRGFDKILQLLLASLRENSPVIRAKAMRAVSIIVEADPEVLCDKLVQTAVEGRFCDQAISVREAALELVGRHIASHPDVGLKYFEKVAERTKDTGVSVRKRAIRIIKDMCTSNTNFAEFTTACIEIISRINDEESSIQDLVCKTFYEFWFEEFPNSQSYVFGDGSSVSLELVKKTEQIVEMLRMMSGHQLLIVVIKRNLALDFFPQSAKAVGISPILIASVRKRCELMCKCLLEKILQVVEANGDEGERCMLPYILLLHAFCVVDPTLCAPASDPSQFVVTLQPYLKSQADNRLAARLLESIIFIINSILPLLRKLPQTAVEELEQDLKQMIVRHPFLTVVHACIKYISTLT
ncbi:chromatin/chromatin-binding, or -regulatory protein [Lithospermum erythrorhizon]|uniref:Chromatin/chromatin-binding, or -regulatory protein n=1 Tax=Lithospermum erythrorhizon TaxID=34254 RepID=A0AAV3RRH5_LITER